MRLVLMWVRRVVDDFPAALRFYRPAMSPVSRPAAGEPERSEVLGWIRLWNCSETSHLELELVARDRFAELLGSERRPDDVTLIFSADDLSAAVAELTGRGATGVVEPRDEAVGSSRFAQLREPTGMLVEVQEPHVASFGSRLVRAPE